MTSRNYSANAQSTTLTAGINNTVTTVPVAATTGFPAAPFILALDYGVSTQEVVLVTGVSGLNLTVTRGYDSTTAQAHSLGAVVTHTHSAVDFRDSRTHENASTGIHGITGAVVGTTDAQAVTNKDFTSATNSFPTSLVTATGAKTLTNKTIDLASNNLSMTKAQLNAAVTDADVVTLDGTESLSNKTIDLGTNNITGTTTQLNATLTGSDFLTTTDLQAMSNKTLDLSVNTVTGTVGDFNNALNGDDFVTLTGSETLTNKTITSGTVGGATIGDTGWTALTLATGTGTAEYRVKNGITEVRLTVVVSIAQNTTTTIVAAGGLPASARPSVNTFTLAIAANIMGYIVVGTDGSVAVRALTGALTGANGVATYVG